MAEMSDTLHTYPLPVLGLQIGIFVLTLFSRGLSSQMNLSAFEKLRMIKGEHL